MKGGGVSRRVQGGGSGRDSLSDDSIFHLINFIIVFEFSATQLGRRARYANYANPLLSPASRLLPSGSSGDISSLSASKDEGSTGKLRALHYGAIHHFLAETHDL